MKQIDPGRNARSAAHFKEKAHRQKRRWASGEIESGREDLNLRPLGPEPSALIQAELRPVNVCHLKRHADLVNRTLAASR